MSSAIYTKNLTGSTLELAAPFDQALPLEDFLGPDVSWPGLPPGPHLHIVSEDFELLPPDVQMIRNYFFGPDWQPGVVVVVRYTDYLTVSGDTIRDWGGRSFERKFFVVFSTGEARCEGIMSIEWRFLTPPSAREWADANGMDSLLPYLDELQRLGST